MPSSLVWAKDGTMGKGNFTEDFKRDAVAQIVERGYPLAEVS
jgi:transposase